VSPNLGLGQGSGASLPGFMALSSLIINAYHRLGHGAKILSLYSSCLFHLSAVMYVDDTDLLHWPESAAVEPKELIAQVQNAMMDYGRLAQASGGILKEKKCSVYFLDYKFVNGWARMKLLLDLPPPQEWITEAGRTYPLHISFPQPVGPDIPIETHDVLTASKMLGVHFSPAGNSITHVDHMVEKGLDWVECLRSKPVSQRDAGLSLYFQLLPSISWGLVTVCMQPATLDKKFQWVYAKALPFLSVNCKMKREWRTCQRCTRA
jgi:hypothetical protein